MSITKRLLSIDHLCVCACLGLLLFAGSVYAHDEQRSDTSWTGWPDESSYHAIWNGLIANSDAAATISVSKGYRVIRSDGLPDHATGRFPNRDNPNRIRRQSLEYRVPAQPVYQARTTSLGLWPFGVALNGVPFDPGAAEFWRGDPRLRWQYEALGGAVNLGLDSNNAHVQPNGQYHDHGVPVGLLARLQTNQEPVLIGYAADGFPIYGPIGYRNANDTSSKTVELKSSYRLKPGLRNGGPGGRYDGSFVRDYKYQRGLGDLDECNGRKGVTPEYPGGTYYYVISKSFPFVPRCFHGVPDRSFMRGPGMGPPMGPHGQGNNQHPPPGPPGSRGPEPPAEAIAVCQGKRAGDRVSFATPFGHTVTGTCTERGGRLFAIPR